MLYIKIYTGSLVSTFLKTVLSVKFTMVACTAEKATASMMHDDKTSAPKTSTAILSRCATIASEHLHCRTVHRCKEDISRPTVIRAFHGFMAFSVFVVFV